MANKIRVKLILELSEYSRLSPHWTGGSAAEEYSIKRCTYVEKQLMMAKANQSVDGVLALLQ